MAEEHEDLPSLCSALIDLANERGGPDNVTVVAARFDGEGLPEPDSRDGAGYQVYNVGDQDTTEIVTEPDPAARPEAVPQPRATAATAADRRTRRARRESRGPASLLLAAALIALVVLLLSAIL